MKRAPPRGSGMVRRGTAKQRCRRCGKGGRASERGAEIVALAALGQAPTKKTAGGDGLGVLHWPGMGWWGLCVISPATYHMAFLAGCASVSVPWCGV